MSSDIGFAAATPSLPDGGGAVGGLGETFTPDLSTGGGSLAVRIDLPNGPGDIGPRLRLRYDTGQPNGPYGLGFAIPLPRLLRSTAHGYPAYDDTDPIVLEGAGELVRLPGGRFRPQVDGGAWRIAADGDGFRLLDREGTTYLLGTTAAGRQGSGTQVAAWHLERIEDALGESVDVRWHADGGRLYLAGLAYGRYDVAFEHEARPDVLRDGRTGVLVSTGLRCHRITLALAGDPVRRWDLGYQQHEANGASLLRSVTLTGIAADGTELAAPPLTLGWTGPARPTLTRFRATDPGAAPGPLRTGTTRTELVDWTGDGLPDVLEVQPSGHARVWPNLGGCVWGRPRPAGDLPGLGVPYAAVVLADLSGDGLADLVRADQPIAGFVPRDPAGEGFGRPVAFRAAPAVSAADPAVRFADLDGDGVLDLLSSGPAGLALHYRRDPGGWAPRPQVVDGPVADLADPRVFLADMTGDGGTDLVRVDGGGVTYWPYLGLGRWAAPVRMADPPVLPAGLEPGRVLVSDVDGDGCADVLVLDGDRVRVWLNRSGVGFAPPREVRAVPTQRMTDVRVADMTGSGTAGLLWPMGPAYFFLDLLGGDKPYLLSSVDNGVGQVTRLGYGTSAQEAGRDAAAGRRWRTRLPIVIPVVTRLDTTDAATGVTATTLLRYHEGRYDGPLREFAGFGAVEEEQLGDATAPTLLVRRTFSTGLDPDTGAEPRDTAARLRSRALRGRLLTEERYGLDGAPEQDRPYDRLEQRWRVDTEDATLVPRLVDTVRTTFERAVQPAAVLTTRNLVWDAAGNVVESVQTSQAPGDPGSLRVLRTVTDFAAGERFAGKPCRVTQTDGAGTVVADTVTRYDDRPEGELGALGLVTARDSLVLTDALVTDVYGAAPPDLAALGYTRRPGETGWWAPQGRWTRSTAGGGLTGTATNATGGTTRFAFDDGRSVPVSVTDPFGNTVTVDHDPRTSRVARLTDAAGGVSTARYDALSRLVATVDPGDTDALPTRTVAYDTGALPVVTTSATRSVAGEAGTVVVREAHDGQGRLLERRLRDRDGEIRTASTVFGSRGLVARTHLPARAASAAYVVPDADEPHTSYGYDALGRVVRQDNPDGSVRTAAYGPLVVVQADEEDTRAGGEHEGTPTTRRFDPTGRLARVEERLGDRTLVSTYTYDVKGELVTHTDPAGHVVRMWHDLLGRALRVDRPEQSTRSVFDAAGNAVEARSADGVLVTRVFDEGNRPVTVHDGPATGPVSARFTYHDAGRPAPADAGARTSGGRCVRVDDGGGSIVLDYDQRGQVTRKTCLPAGGGRYQLDVVHRSDGQLASVEYPSEAAGGPRLLVRYSYDEQGRLAAVPGVATAVGHDLAGRRVRVALPNGTTQAYGYDEPTGRLVDCRLTGPAGELRAVTLTRDRVGNVTAVDGPAAALAGTYGYDDLYRLTAAATGPDAWAYEYDDAGALTARTGVGDYGYGAGGAPATCLTSAGPDTFEWDALGRMTGAPWGDMAYDAHGRLVTIGAASYGYDYAGVRVRTTTPDSERLTPDPLFAIEDGALVLHLFDGVGLVGRRVAATGATVFLHPDHLGGLAVVTDAAGAVLDTLRHDPYGVLLERTGAGPADPVGFGGGAPDPTGLLYLSARWYAPQLGIFLAPDAVVQDAGLPIAWNPYAYAGDNPVTLTDPSGRSFWGIFLAALVIVALVVITVLSFGVLSVPAAIVALGLVTGGVVGGLAAHQKGGSTEDIITGIFVGAAVGGTAAFFAAAGGGAAAAGGMHLSGFWGAVVAGAINGAVSGAALGFAAGFAGGKGTLDDIVTKMWQGALVGLVSGAVIGGLAYAVSPPEVGPLQAARDAYKTPPPGTSESIPGAPGSLPPSPTPPITDAGEALGKVTGSLAGKGLGAAATNVGAHVLSGNWSGFAQLLVVDTAVGLWDLGYVPKILKEIGVVNIG